MEKQYHGSGGFFVCSVLFRFLFGLGFFLRGCCLVVGWFVFPREEDIMESLKILKSLVIKRNTELYITIQYSLHADLKPASDTNRSVFFSGISVGGPCFTTQFFWE